MAPRLNGIPSDFSRKERAMTRTMSYMTIAAVVLMLGVGCRSMTGQSLGTNIDNKTTTAKVKARLTAERIQNLTWVDVDTSEGTVYLTGTAATEAQKARATEIARSVEGVKQVVNNIEIRPRAAAPAPAAPAASPATGAVPGHHTLTGEVTSVNHTDGSLTLKTREGDLMLRLPPAALANVEQGDRVTVDLGLTQSR
jgi:hypothetical protein